MEKGEGRRKRREKENLPGKCGKDHTGGEEREKKNRMATREGVRRKSIDKSRIGRHWGFLLPFYLL